ncbi:hypothetical protein MRB53_021249 [Persea americana]|uniref:Uncharacterized protein n=1 Tax=Persea americana TaxID=3435 RepID=A0ACC2L372_PERAE|nr:hypothetical protein MRB53_021249 [Persea americana]
MAPSISTNPLLSLLFTFLLSLSIFHPLTTAQPLNRKCETALNYTSNSTYASNLNTLLASLPSNASRNNGFYNTTVGPNQDTVYGLVLCRGDVTPAICQSCLDGAIKEIKQLCPNNKIAAIWYEYCQLRYSDKRFFSLMEDAGKITLVNTASITNPTEFLPVLKDLLSNLSNKAANDPSLGMFATEETKFMGSQDVYGLAQCTRDLSMNDCRRCLEGAAGDVMGCCSSNRGARVLTTSCNLRFELYPFYTASDPGPTPPTPALPNPTSKGSDRKSPQIIIAIVVPIVVVLGLFFIIITCYIRRKPKKKSNDEEEISSVESLQLDLDTIKVATNNFSDENKLGHGGFGAVYKYPTLVLPIQVPRKRDVLWHLRSPQIHLSFSSSPLFLSLSTTFHTLTTADPLYQSCETTFNYTSNSTFESNLNTLLASLPSNASRNNGFYNTTIGKNQDTVYGLALCRGDVKKSICQSCLDGAIKEIKQLCPNNKIAAIWYEYCQLHYSDTRFFSLMEDATKVTLVNTANIANPAQFLPVLNDMLSNISTRAVNDPSLGMFATEKTKFMWSQDVYGLVQCTRDLSMNDCSRCLQGAAGDVIGCCSSNRGARVLTTSCNLRFELYPFYTDSGPTSASPVSPSTSTVSKGM